MVPNSNDDDSLLIELLKVLDMILSSPRQTPEPVVAWVARVVLQRDGPQMTMLRNVQSTAGSQTVSESKRWVPDSLVRDMVLKLVNKNDIRLSTCNNLFITY